MTEPEVATGIRATVVYDGDCGFCTASARWLERRIDPSVRVEMSQALDLGSLGLTDDEAAAAAWFVDSDGSRYRGHAAVGRSLQHMSLPYRVVGWIIQRPPVSWIAAPVYRLVATYRHRLPGATDSCRLD